MKKTFIILSVITPWNSNAWTYGPRSLYSPDERFYQTMDTINSIRKFGGEHAKIILIEGGACSYKKEISPVVDKYVYAANSLIVRNAVGGKSKAFGEVMLWLSAMPFIIRNKSHYYWKISGRYKLNERFLDADWQYDMICGKDVYGNRLEISTRLIGFPYKKILLIIKALLRRFFSLLNPKVVFEGYLLKGMGLQNVCFLEKIGVEGNIAVTGKKIEE